MNYPEYKSKEAFGMCYSAPGLNVHGNSQNTRVLKKWISSTWCHNSCLWKGCKKQTKVVFWIIHSELANIIHFRPDSVASWPPRGCSPDIPGSPDGSPHAEKVTSSLRDLLKQRSSSKSALASGISPPHHWVTKRAATSQYSQKLTSFDDLLRSRGMEMQILAFVTLGWEQMGR